MGRKMLGFYSTKTFFCCHFVDCFNAVCGWTVHTVKQLMCYQRTLYMSSVMFTWSEDVICVFQFQTKCMKLNVADLWKWVRVSKAPRISWSKTETKHWNSSRLVWASLAIFQHATCLESGDDVFVLMLLFKQFD